MSGSTKQLLVIAAALAAAACTDLTNDSANSIALSPAFLTVPVGFSANSNSFDPSGDAGVGFFPEAINPAAGFDRGGGIGGGGDGRRRDGDHHDGFGPEGLRGLLMGGGLGPDFIGGIGFGHGKGRGPFGTFSLPDSCTFSSITGRVTCPETTRHDLTVNVSFAFKNTDGDPQAAFDTITTNSVNVQTHVFGTKTRREGTATSTLDHTSDRTVSGLAQGSTSRTVNGTAEAHESTVGTREGVAFTAVRDAAETTTALVIPIVDGHPTIPSSGSVIRTMTVTITPEGGEVRTKTRREEVTFDGTNVVKIKITQDGTTKNCTLTLPGKDHLVCE